MHRGLPCFLLLTLAACGENDAEESAAAARPGSPAAYETPVVPNHAKANWRVAEDGKSIVFGPDEAIPLLSLACRLQADPPRLAIRRHTPAPIDASALFPVIGNGTTSRFGMEALLTPDGRIWEGVVLADDPMLDVFTGPRPVEATLPGGGTLRIVGSRLPGEFIAWCRNGGKTPDPDTDGAGDAQEGEPVAAS